MDSDGDENDFNLLGDEAPDSEVDESKCLFGSQVINDVTKQLVEELLLEKCSGHIEELDSEYVRSVVMEGLVYITQ